MLRTVCLFALLLPLALAAEPLWLEDWSAALAASAASGKPVLVDVTGSDWAPPARRMELEVFSLPEFSRTAPAQFVLLRLDYPRGGGQSEKVRAQNAKLAETLPLDNLPMTLVLDKTGFVWGLHTGAVAGGPSAYLKLAAGLWAQKAELEALRKAADAAAPGAEKAKALHALFLRVDEAGLAFEFASVPTQVIANDKDNKLGLAGRYQVYARYTRLVATWASRDDLVAVVKDLTDLAKQASGQADLQQKILFTRGMVQWNALGDQVAAKASLKEALALGADTPTGQRVLTLWPELP